MRDCDVGGYEQSNRPLLLQDKARMVELRILPLLGKVLREAGRMGSILQPHPARRLRRHPPRER